MTTASTPVPVSSLPAATVPLTGTEAVPISQGGNLVQVAASNIVTASGVTAGTYGDNANVAQVTVSKTGQIATAANVAISASAIGAVPTSRTLTAGTGLTGGGDLSANRSFAIDVTGVSAATYGGATVSAKVAVNAQGQVTSASDVTITPAVGSITGLGTGVATFLATPSSANLAAAVTDETGTAGSLVFSKSPALVTPDLGTPSAITLTNATGMPAAGITGTLGADHGGTGVANAAGSTITLGGALTTSGAFTTTLTATGNTSVTLPTSGTLLSTAAAVTVAQGGTGATSLTDHGVLIGSGTDPVTALAVAAAGTVLGGVASSDPAFTATPVLGVAGATAGTLGLSGNTSGVVTLRTAAAAGTFDFYFPTSMGSATQILTSAGAGAAPTWETSSSASLDVQVFTGNGTWTKPGSAKWVVAFVVGGGGGGGSGGRSASAGGGGGAAGGNNASAMFNASNLGATESVTIGAAGTGGTAITADNTAGNNGVAGGTTSFGNFVKAAGGTLGSGGPTNSVSGGASSATLQTAYTGAQGSAGGASGQGVTAAVAGTARTTIVSATGGGGGGGINGGGVAAAAAGGDISSLAVTVTGGTAGAAATNGGAGNTAYSLGAPVGAGGGGGGAGNGATGGTGGAGGAYGGGGGGGGAATNGNNTGAGGAGGAGYCVVITWV